MTVQRSVACLRGEHINCTRSAEACACNCHQPGATPVEDTIGWLNQAIAAMRVPAELLTEPTDKNAALSEPLESLYERILSRLGARGWCRVRRDNSDASKG